MVDDREVQPIAFGNRSPVMNACATQRIHPQFELRFTNGVHVDYIAKVADVGRQVIVPVGGAGAKSLLVGYPKYPSKACRQKLVRSGLNPSGDAAVGRAAVGRVV